MAVLVVVDADGQLITCARAQRQPPVTARADVRFDADAAGPAFLVYLQFRERLTDRLAVREPDDRPPLTAGTVSVVEMNRNQRPPPTE